MHSSIFPLDISYIHCKGAAFMFGNKANGIHFSIFFFILYLIKEAFVFGNKTNGTHSSIFFLGCILYTLQCSINVFEQGKLNRFLQFFLTLQWSINVFEQGKLNRFLQFFLTLQWSINVLEQGKLNTFLQFFLTLQMYGINEIR